MKKIDNVGNLPKHLTVLAKNLGQYTDLAKTDFYEMSSEDELVKNAVEVGYEVIPTIDMSTGRGFLVGFDAKETSLILNTAYFNLDIYFYEMDSDGIKRWDTRIRKDRNDQQIEMNERHDRATRRRQERKERKKLI